MTNSSVGQGQLDSSGVRQSALVLGGGFAGLESAIELRHAGYAVTLVSERSHLFVYPTSIWVVTGEHRVEQDLLDLVDMAKHHQFEFVVGPIESLDPRARRVTVGGQDLQADLLILAMGAGRKRIPGMEHTQTIWGSPDDTVRVATLLRSLVDKGEGRIAIGFGGNPADPSAIRGGPAFEVMFNIVHMLKKLGLRNRFDLTFFAPMPNPGSRLGDKAAMAVRTQLQAAGVNLRFGKAITRFDASGVQLEGSERIDADLVIYVPGGAGHPLLAQSGLPLNEAGFVRIDSSCKVDGYDNVYAVGDVAALEGPEWRSKQGHLAEVMARVAVASIVSRASGESPHQSYLDHMSIVCLMDSGNGGAFVERNSRHARIVPLPLVGHWLKKAWGYYYRFTKYRFGAWVGWALRELFARRGRALPAPHQSCAGVKANTHHQTFARCRSGSKQVDHRSLLHLAAN